MRRLGASFLVMPLAWLAVTQTARADTVQLVAGCQILGLSAYPPGTYLPDIAADIDGGSPRLWFFVPQTNSFELFDPASPERSTKTVLSAADDAAFICVDGQAAWNRAGPETAEPTSTPSREATPTPVPTSTPSMAGGGGTGGIEIGGGYGAGGGGHPY